MILGYDVSTIYIGYCLLDDSGSFVDIGYICLDKIKNEYDKLDAIVQTLHRFSNIDSLKIFVEAPLKRSNNQHVVNILQRWNGMFCGLIYRYLGVQPQLIPESDVRKINGIKVPKGVKGVSKKKYILQCVQDLGIIPEDTWKLKRTGTPKDFSFDMADAYWVAKAGYLSE